MKRIKPTTHNGIMAENHYRTISPDYKTCETCRHYAVVQFMSGNKREVCEIIGIADDAKAEVANGGTCKKWQYRVGTWPRE